jgi:hypothetical protein
MKKADNECNLEAFIVSCGIAHIKSLNAQERELSSIERFIVDTATRISGHSPEKISKLLLQFESNNFGVTDDLLQCIASGVYPLSAMMNHSCKPNCILRYSYTPSGPELHVIALSDILAGEELVHSYVDCAEKRSVRQAKLKDVYGFNCECIKCSEAQRYHMVPKRLLDAQNLQELYNIFQQNNQEASGQSNFADDIDVDIEVLVDEVNVPQVFYTIICFTEKMIIYIYMLIIKSLLSG